MRKSLKSALAAALCGATTFAAPPAEVLAGPMTATSPLRSQALLRRTLSPGYGGYYRRGYYRNYGYDPSGAIFAGAALGLLGAGIAGASGYGYGYPGYGYGYGYPGYGYGYPGYGWGW